MEQKKKTFALKKGHILLICLLAVVVFAVFGNKGFVDAYRLKKERDGILSFNKIIELENKSLEKDIQLLKSDKRYLEHVAKKELGMLGKNDVLYRLPAQNPDAKAK